MKPIDIMEGKADFMVANMRTVQQQLYDAARINRKRKPANLQVGSNVLIDLPERYQAKFVPKRIGPFKITEKINNEIVKTDRKMPFRDTTFHANDMRVVP